jgi:hypothetical protein
VDGLCRKNRSIRLRKTKIGQSELRMGTAIILEYYSLPWSLFMEKPSSYSCSLDGCCFPAIAITMFMDFLAMILV